MNEDELIYGVNPNGYITPIMVRDAIVLCFYQAHNSELDSIFKDISFKDKQKLEEFKYHHIEMLIRTFFNEVNGDFNHPTKQSLTDVVYKCKQFAQSFRDQAIIEKNASLIQTLITNIKEK